VLRPQIRHCPPSEVLWHKLYPHSLPLGLSGTSFTGLSTKIRERTFQEVCGTTSDPKQCRKSSRQHSENRKDPKKIQNGNRNGSDNPESCLVREKK